MKFGMSGRHKMRVRLHAKPINMIPIVVGSLSVLRLRYPKTAARVRRILMMSRASMSQAMEQ